jgi:hypothetical protein
MKYFNRKEKRKGVVFKEFLTLNLFKLKKTSKTLNARVKITILYLKTQKKKKKVFNKNGEIKWRLFERAIEYK